MVTVSIDKCIFRKAGKPGHLIKIYAQVEEIGRTSITMNVEARRHNVYNGDQQVILSTNIKFVRVDEDGNPIPISDRVRDKFNNNKKVNDE
jgi:acyl-CoA thioesterase YciA